MKNERLIITNPDRWSMFINNQIKIVSMVKFKIFFLVFIVSIGTLQAKQIKLLAIGNSFSDDAVEHYLHGLVAAAGDTIIIGNMYIGGCSLEKHHANSINNSSNYSYRKIIDGVKITTPNYNLIDAISDEEWDYISLQQVSPHSGQYESFFPYINHLTQFVKEHSTNPDMEIVLHATWAYEQSSTHAGFANYDNDQISMYNAIIDATSKVARDVGIDIVIPAGTAIQNGRTTTLGDTFCRDGYHLNHYYGRYTASCAWYEKLFHKSIVGNSYIPPTITQYEARIAQLSAHHAVKNPEKITVINVSEYSWRFFAS